MFYSKKDKNFISCFDPQTGFYFRTGILDKDGNDTGVDPFMSSFPELLDVGIMGHCAHGKSGLCIKAGIECYQNGLNSNMPNMTVEDFRAIAEQCRHKTYQFALGGAGDPDQHECFEEILAICKDNDIVPNFTTSGFGMTRDIAKLCKKYCGAVAVSWYRSPYTIQAIEYLLQEGVKTNIHYVLSKSTITEAYHRLEENSFYGGINAVVFLLHKPVGLGTQNNVIQLKDESVQNLLTLIDKSVFPFKIGFDSCTVPAIIQHSKNIDTISVDTCEAARWSAYITSDMKMLPCSFDNQAQKWAVSLRENTIQEAWNSEAFQKFRKIFQTACPECPKRDLCLGGCPICPEIVLCDKREEHACITEEEAMGA